MKKVSDRHHSFPSETWMELYNSRFDNESKALFIDVDDDDDSCNAEDHEYSEWADLPDLILEKIFSYLSIRQKYYASLVCKSWYGAFYLPQVWSQFILEDSTLTRARFNYYSGWQYVLDHVRTQTCITQVGRNFQHLIFEPMQNFYNLYEFMNMMSWYIEQTKGEISRYGVGKRLKSLKFTFHCNMPNSEETEKIRLFGTGGKLLSALIRLMGNIKAFKKLELIDLMLDPNEAQFLLDNVCENCCLKLDTLNVVNATKIPYQMLHVGVFLNLRILVMSPQNLGDDLIELLGYTALRHLHILQNKYTPNDPNFVGISKKSWSVCRTNNRKLSVHLQLQTTKEKRLIWQECAPVKTILFDSPAMGLQIDILMTALELYKTDLVIFGHQNIPRFYRAKSFHERIDSPLLLLCRQCPSLKVLVITERISTATVLLIAHTVKNLQYLYIRGNAVIKRCDWPQNPDWSNEFYEWLKFNSRSYLLVEKEVSQILGYNWQMLTDKQFKNLHINLYQENVFQ